MTRVTAAATTDGVTRPTRVAIYTRKSVTEGLDQQFNTLDAQRQSIMDFINSQRGEGWIAIDKHYDDGGFSGSSVDRPAFQQLLEHIENNEIDVVAVYKIDRLSRSLSDFARIMEFFETHDVTFVSITQQFNTTTSMGKLMLNILMSFAEFERETIAERTKDKMAATRRRGQWTGGRPVLGYDVHEKKLVVNGDEAKKVCEIFSLYLRYASLLNVAKELNHRGWTKKRHVTKKGAAVGGGPWNKCDVRYLITNPLYMGKVSYDGTLFDGQHEPIVDHGTWQGVQELLKANAPVTQARRSDTSSLLSGLVRCAVCGSAMTPTTTKKPGKLYRYYACISHQKTGSKQCAGSRVPAHKFEQFVVEQISKTSTTTSILSKIMCMDDDVLGESSHLFHDIFDDLPLDEQRRLITLLIAHVSYDPRSGEIMIEQRAIVTPTHANVGEV